jgi:hypothetical protein
MNLGTQTIVRKRAGVTQGDYGNASSDWGNPESLTIAGCSVQPAAGSELVDNREAITTMLIVYAPITADVIDTDRVEYAGTIYDIDGPVDVWAVGTPLDHKVIRLKRVSG